MRSGMRIATNNRQVGNRAGGNPIRIKQPQNPAAARIEWLPALPFHLAVKNGRNVITGPV